ncbi:P-loop containing nucleoside triphosphate hydrolase, partial [Trema orientale]
MVCAVCVEAFRASGVETERSISREPTLLVTVVAVPNVGKSALINSIHQIALTFWCVLKLLDLVEIKLRRVFSTNPTLLVMVVGVPNIGKSALINSIKLRRLTFL